MLKPLISSASYAIGRSLWAYHGRQSDLRNMGSHEVPETNVDMIGVFTYASIYELSLMIYLPQHKWVNMSIQ